MGLLGGLAFWTHILATYYLLTALGVIALGRLGRQTPARLGYFARPASLVGDFPGILWNAGNEWLSFRWWSLDAETAAAPDRSGRLVTISSEQVFATSLSVLSGYWPREAPPWPAAFWKVALTLVIPAVCVFFAWKSRRRLLRIGPESMMLGFAVLVVLVFAQSSFGWMTDEPRYLLFLFSVVPVFLGAGLGCALAPKRRIAAVVVAAGLAVVNLRGDLHYLGIALESDPVNREFVRRVDELGVRYVQSDYHLSYKYVFLSHGRVVWTSELGPSQTEWYFPFRDEVARAEHVALVPRSFRFARRIGRRLDARGITLSPRGSALSDPVRLQRARAPGRPAMRGRRRCSDKARYVLAVPDVERSARFYRDVLGFEVREVEDPGWRFFVRDECFIMAGECPDAIPLPASWETTPTSPTSTWTRRTRSTGSSPREGVEVTKALTSEPWGMREFGIRTVDGHRIMFGEELARDPPV